MRMRFFSIFIVVIFCSMLGTFLFGEGINPSVIALQEERVLQWRKKRDEFFKSHERSPLTSKEKENFKGLIYYPFNPKYVFIDQIKGYIFHINNPNYYVIFLPHKGTCERYIQCGKFNFNLNGKEYSIQVYESILSETLFIPFKDMTNWRETHEGGRYIDSEILAGYKMVLDFNMAYNPPCAYNGKSVCVLPPKENVLNINIQAGEKIFKSF